MQARLCWTTIAMLLGAAAVGSGAFGQSNEPSASCPSGSKPAVVGGTFKCLRVGQRCKARYQGAYKRYGFTCTNGRLRKRTAAPATPPPPSPPPTPPPAPPPPPAQPGHYHGTTSQLEVIDFDVRSDGLGVTNLSTGQINQGCTPPGHIYGGGIRNGFASIGSDGTFVIDFSVQGSFSDGTPYTGHLNLTGHFGGATATGTLTASLNFTANGTGYSCGSGQQTWTASRTG